jgi:ATP-binding cassette subfamily F protein 3
LSVGERSKTALAKLLFNQFNVLVFDEPTNHIELSAREAFEDALENYSGTVLLVTHDRYLLDRIATEVYDMERYRHYKGSYSEYIKSLSYHLN